MTLSTGRRSGARAVSLVELLVVLAVVAMVVTLSIPGITGYQQQMQTKAVLRQMMGLLSAARNKAISTQMPHGVALDAEAGRVVIRNLTSGEALESQLRVPPGVEVSFALSDGSGESAPVIFRPGGALQGRSVTISVANRRRRYTLRVTAATGAITLGD